MLKENIRFILLFLSLLFGTHLFAQIQPAEDLPDSVFSGRQGDFHVQGIAVDQKSKCIYFSFTDKLIKTDYSGKEIGSVIGFVGHLGDLAFDPETEKIYASLEYKDDAIGKGIREKLGVKNTNDINFYVAIFDGHAITRPDMKADESDVLKTFYLREVVDDYLAEVVEDGKTLKHRFGCSGIDGITIGPSFGKRQKKKKYLYVAYGIYGDTTRTDNDRQVILKYDLEKVNTNTGLLSQATAHHIGSKPEAKYFVMTGNTRYGIQNFEYDPYTGNFLAAVYHGTKSEFPNYDLFVIDGHKKPQKEKWIGSAHQRIKVETLSLLNDGLKDKKTGIRGWYFKWGATGLFPVGDGYFYISHNKTLDGEQSSTIYKYKWVGGDRAFEKVR